jgi:hypothetical protein
MQNNVINYLFNALQSHNYFQGMGLIKCATRFIFHNSVWRTDDTELNCFY